MLESNTRFRHLYICKSSLFNTAVTSLSDSFASSGFSFSSMTASSAHKFVQRSGALGRLHIEQRHSVERGKRYRVVPALYRGAVHIEAPERHRLGLRSLHIAVVVQNEREPYRRAVKVAGFPREAFKGAGKLSGIHPAGAEVPAAVHFLRYRKGTGGNIVVGQVNYSGCLCHTPRISRTPCWCRP